jgi:hypothetical protein
MYAVGKPLLFPHTGAGGGEPSAEELDLAHQEFCRALTDVFDRYKHFYGWGHKVLRIV